MWDPKAYLRFTEERGRPFHDLVARIAAVEPRAVVDLGCGPGHLTETLLQRWPTARVAGIDSSPEMIAEARARGGAVTYHVQDVREYRPDDDVDVIVTNAMLQWVPEHDGLVTGWVADGRWIAIQVPGNHDALWQLALREVARDFGAEPLLLDRAVPDARHYTRLLRRAGCEVDAWETSYLHQLPVARDTADGTADTDAVHPVLTWMSGTALRPVRAALSDPDWTRFGASLDRVLWERYPPDRGVVDFPFLRVFVVARRPL